MFQKRLPDVFNTTMTELIFLFLFIFFLFTATEQRQDNVGGNVRNPEEVSTLEGNGDQDTNRPESPEHPIEEGKPNQNAPVNPAEPMPDNKQQDSPPPEIPGEERLVKDETARAEGDQSGFGLPPCLGHPGEFIPLLTIEIKGADFENSKALIQSAYPDAFRHEVAGVSGVEELLGREVSSKEFCEMASVVYRYSRDADNKFMRKCSFYMDLRRHADTPREVYLIWYFIGTRYFLVANSNQVTMEALHGLTGSNSEE